MSFDWVYKAFAICDVFAKTVFKGREGARASSLKGNSHQKNVVDFSFYQSLFVFLLLIRTFHSDSKTSEIQIFYPCHLHLSQEGSINTSA